MSSLRIRSCLARTALAIWLVSSLGIGLAAPPAGFDERVESLCTTVGLPGISIAIVENGNVTHANGYGVRRLGAAEPVTAATRGWQSGANHHDSRLASRRLQLGLS